MKKKLIVSLTVLAIGLVMVATRSGINNAHAERSPTPSSQDLSLNHLRRYLAVYCEVVLYPGLLRKVQSYDIGERCNIS